MGFPTRGASEEIAHPALPVGHDFFFAGTEVCFFTPRSTFIHTTALDSLKNTLAKASVREKVSPLVVVVREQHYTKGESCSFPFSTT